MKNKEAEGGFFAAVCVAGKKGQALGNYKGQYLELREIYDPISNEKNMVVIGSRGQIGYLEPQPVVALFLWKLAGAAPKCYYCEEQDNGTSLVYLSKNEAVNLLL